MVSYKIEEREEQVYHGYTWTCNIETDISEIWTEFYNKEKDYFENPIVIKTNPNENGQFTYSICIQGYSLDNDLSDYDTVTMPEGRYVRLLLTGPKEKSIEKGWKFALSNFDLKPGKNMELYGKSEKTSSDFSMNILIPILWEKTKIDKLLWRGKKLLENQFAKRILAVVGSTIAVATLAKMAISKSEEELDNPTSSNTVNNVIDEAESYTDSFNEENVVAEHLTSERNSPHKHMVQGHYQKYHTNEGTVTKFVGPYIRGGEKEEPIEIEDFYEYDDNNIEETLDLYDAADIWASNGKDEDYLFGYSEEELESALNDF